MVNEVPEAYWRRRLHRVVFEAETRSGRIFDVIVIGLILLSVAAVVLESNQEIRALYGRELYIAEWAFTLLFTAEYFLRLIAVKRPIRYAG